MTRCMFADFQNQVWEGNFPARKEENVFGIDLAVSISDGPELSEHRRRELALARLLQIAIELIRNTGPSDLDIRIENAKDMIREFKFTYPETREI